MEPKFEVPSVGSEHRRIMLQLINAGYQIMIIIYGIEANFDAAPLIEAMKNCLGKPVLLKLQGNTFKCFTNPDLAKSGVHLLPAVLHALECKDLLPLNQVEDMDNSESEADPFVDVIDVKQNGLIEISGWVFKNQPDVRIKWTVIDGVKKVKSGSEKGVSQNAAFLVIYSSLKMLRFIGSNVQIFYSGGISAAFGVLTPLLQPAGEKGTASASHDYVRMVALAGGCFFAACSWMLTLSESNKDLGIIAAACAFFSMIIGLFSAIFSVLVPEYRVCFVGIFTVFLLLVAFYVSWDQDIKTTLESSGGPGPSTSTSPSTKSFSSLSQTLLGRTSLGV